MFQGSSHLLRPPSEEKGFPRSQWESDFGGRPWAQEGGLGVLGWVVQGRDRALRGQWARANLSQRDHGCPGTGGHGHHLGFGAPATQKRSSFEPPSSPAPVSRHFLSLVLSPLPAIFLLPLCPSFLSFSLSFLYVGLSLDVGLSAVSASLRSVSRCLSLPSGSLSLSHHLTLSPAVTSTSVGPRLL